MNYLTALQKNLVEILFKSYWEKNRLDTCASDWSWPNSYDDEPFLERNKFELGGRGHQFYRATCRNSMTVQGQPFFTIRQKKGQKYSIWNEATYSPFEKIGIVHQTIN